MHKAWFCVLLALIILLVIARENFIDYNNPQAVSFWQWELSKEKLENKEENPNLIKLIY